MLSLVVALLIWKGAASDDRRAPATIIRGVLIGVGLASLVGVATQHPALWLTFVTMLYWLGALVESSRDASRPATAPRMIWVFALLLALGVAAGQAWSATRQLRVPIRAMRTGFPYAYGFSPPERDATYGEIRWTARHAVAVVPAEHAYFQMTAWVPHQDAATNPVRVRLWHGATLAADITSRGDAPITRLLKVREGQRFLMIELDVSRPSSQGHGLKIAGRWLRNVPPHAAPDSVVW